MSFSTLCMVNLKPLAQQCVNFLDQFECFNLTANSLINQVVTMVNRQHRRYIEVRSDNESNHIVEMTLHDASDNQNTYRNTLKRDGNSHSEAMAAAYDEIASSAIEG